MELAEYLSALKQIKDDFKLTKQDKSCLPICTQFYQVFANHVTNKKITIESSLSSLASTLQLYSELRPQLGSELSWDQLGHVIFVESARVVLGMDFQRLDDVDPAAPKALFKQALGQTYMALQEQHTGEFFLVLQWLVVNGWSHAVLQDMMKGSDIADEKAQNFLRSGEYPEIFRLRVDMLMENGCDDFALNLATWCTKSAVFEADAYIRQAQLLLLIKLNRQEEFHNTCWQIWQTQCCLSLRILQAILGKGRDDDKGPLLTLTQTFLVHDWMKPDKYCCTEPLLKFWLSLEREKEPNAEEFIQSVSKMDQLASCPRQLQILIRALATQFPGEFLQFNMECMLKALRMDRNKLDTARVYVKDETETDQAADSLAKSCLIIAVMFSQMHQIQLASNMTAFYLDPTEEMYHMIKKMVLENPPPEKRKLPRPSTHGNSSSSSSDEWDFEDDVEEIPIIPPENLDRHTFFELLHAVDTLRPNTLSIHSTWPKLQKYLRSSLEDAGFTYNHRKDNFITFEEKMVRKRKATEKAQRKKLRDEASVKPAGGNASVQPAGGNASVQPAGGNAPVQQVGDPNRLPSEMKKLGLNDQGKESRSSVDSNSEPQPFEENRSKSSVEVRSVAEQPADTQPVLADTTSPVLADTTSPVLADDSKDAVAMPLLDITLDELQQVLDNSGEKTPSTTSDGVVHNLPTADDGLMQEQEVSEDLMLNSIKEFLKEGDMQMQALPDAETVTTSKPAPGTSTVADGTGQRLQEQERLDNLVDSESEKPAGADDLLFKCKFCGKAYDSVRQRRRHQEWLCKFKVNAAAGERDLVNNPPRERPKPKEDPSLLRDDYGSYICDLCDRVCSNLPALRLHQRRNHNVYKGKSSVSSNVDLKECSVKLDRLEDAPIPKMFKKRDPSPDKGNRGKEGISKLLSKKYTTSFFMSSLNNKEKKAKEASGHKDTKPKRRKPKVPKSIFEKPTDYVRIAMSDGESSGTDEYELVSTIDVDPSAGDAQVQTILPTNTTIDVDLSAGDAQVQTILPTNTTLPVLCDLCGDVCPTYQTMKEHQATCILTPKKHTPRKSPKSWGTTTKTDPADVNAVKMSLFEQTDLSEKKSQVTLVMSSGPVPLSSTATNIVHAIPYDAYVANSLSSQSQNSLAQQAVGLNQPSITPQAVGLNQPSITPQAVGLSQPAIPVTQHAMGLSQPAIPVTQHAMAASQNSTLQHQPTSIISLASALPQPTSTTPPRQSHSALLQKSKTVAPKRAQPTAASYSRQVSTKQQIPHSSNLQGSMQNQPTLHSSNHKGTTKQTMPHTSSSNMQGSTQQTMPHSLNRQGSSQQTMPHSLNRQGSSQQTMPHSLNRQGSSQQQISKHSRPVAKPLASTTQQALDSSNPLANIIPFLTKALEDSTSKFVSSISGEVRNIPSKNDKKNEMKKEPSKKEATRKESVKKEPIKKVQPPKNPTPRNPPKPKQPPKPRNLPNVGNPAELKRKLVEISYRSCNMCNMEFMSASSCFQHQSDMNHFQGGVALMAKFKCADCNQVFNSSMEGEAHINTKHVPLVQKPVMKPAKIAPGRSSKTKVSPQAGGQEIFRSLLMYCQFCKKGFLSQTSLDNHQLQGCEAQAALGSMMVMEQPGVVNDGFDAVMSSVASMMQYPGGAQMPQPVETVAYAVDNMVQLQPTLTNEVVIMGDPMAQRTSILDPITNTYMPVAQLQDPGAMISHMSMDPSQMGSLVVGDGPMAAVSRQEMGTQVDIDDVPLSELENDMKELAPDLMCQEGMIDETELQLEPEEKYLVEGDVQVDSITYKNISMLQHKMWQCSVCRFEFGLKKDIITHWEESACRDQARYIMDADSFQCVHCGEFFPEPKDCRNHQLTEGCLRNAGMKVQLLKNKHLHCKLCKGRYYEKCHVERHLVYYHKIDKDEAAAKVQEWFPDSFIKNLEEMLKVKKDAKQRSRSPEHRDGSKSPRASDKTQSPRKDLTKSPKPQAKDTTTKPAATTKTATENGTTAEKKTTETAKTTAKNTTEIVTSTDIKIETNLDRTLAFVAQVPETNKDPSETASDIPKKKKKKKKKKEETNSNAEKQVANMNLTSGPRTVMSTSVANVQPVPSVTVASLAQSAPVVAVPLFPGSPSPILTTMLAKQTPEALPDAEVLPMSSPMGRPPMPATPDSLRLELGSCGSPVPTCNISWSSSPGSMSTGAPGTPNSGSVTLPAPPVPSKTQRKSKNRNRSSSVESQQSTMSNKEMKGRGRSPVAPAEYHPCPRCGKVIDDGIALRIHMEFVCGKPIVDGSPLKPSKPKKSVEKRQRKNSQGSLISTSQDNGDSRSMFSDDGSMSSTSQVTPGHATAESYTSPARAGAIDLTSRIGFKCDLCEDTFADSMYLEQHIIVSHHQAAHLMKCSGCSVMFDGIRSLQAHQCTQLSNVELPQDLTTSRQSMQLAMAGASMAHDLSQYLPAPRMAIGSGINTVRIPAQVTLVAAPENDQLGMCASSEKVSTEMTPTEATVAAAPLVSNMGVKEEISHPAITAPTGFVETGLIPMVSSQSGAELVSEMSAGFITPVIPPAAVDGITSFMDSPVLSSTNPMQSYPQFSHYADYTVLPTAPNQTPLADPSPTPDVLPTASCATEHGVNLTIPLVVSLFQDTTAINKDLLFETPDTYKEPSVATTQHMTSREKNSLPGLGTVLDSRCDERRDLEQIDPVDQLAQPVLPPDDITRAENLVPPNQTSDVKNAEIKSVFLSYESESLLRSSDGPHQDSAPLLSDLPEMKLLQQEEESLPGVPDSQSCEVLQTSAPAKRRRISTSSRTSRTSRTSTSSRSSNSSKMSNNSRRSNKSVASLVDGIIRDVIPDPSNLGSSCDILPAATDTGNVAATSPSVALEKMEPSPQTEEDSPRSDKSPIVSMETECNEASDVSVGRLDDSTETPVMEETRDMVESICIDDSECEDQSTVMPEAGLILDDQPSRSPIKSEALDLSCKAQAEDIRVHQETVSKETAVTKATEVSDAPEYSEGTGIIENVESTNISDLPAGNVGLPDSPSQDEVNLLDDHNKVIMLKKRPVRQEHTGPNESGSLSGEISLPSNLQSMSNDGTCSTRATHEPTNDSCDEILLLDEEICGGSEGNRCSTNKMEASKDAQDGITESEKVTDITGEIPDVAEAAVAKGDEDDRVNPPLRITRRMQQKMEYDAWEKEKESASLRHGPPTKHTASNSETEKTSQVKSSSKEVEETSDRNVKKDEEFTSGSEKGEESRETTAGCLEDMRQREMTSESVTSESSQCPEMESVSQDIKAKRKIGKPRKLKNRRESTPESVKSVSSQQHGERSSSAKPEETKNVQPQKKRSRSTQSISSSESTQDDRNVKKDKEFTSGSEKGEESRETTAGCLEDVRQREMTSESVASESSQCPEMESVSRDIKAKRKIGKPRKLKNRRESTPESVKSVSSQQHGERSSSAMPEEKNNVQPQKKRSRSTQSISSSESTQDVRTDLPQDAAPAQKKRSRNIRSMSSRESTPDMRTDLLQDAAPAQKKRSHNTQSISSSESTQDVRTDLPQDAAPAQKKRSRNIRSMSSRESTPDMRTDLLQDAAPAQKKRSHNTQSISSSESTQDVRTDLLQDEDSMDSVPRSRRSTRSASSSSEPQRCAARRNSKSSLSSNTSDSIPSTSSAVPTRAGRTRSSSLSPLGISQTPSQTSPLGISQPPSQTSPLGISQTANQTSPLGISQTANQTSPLRISQTPSQTSPLGISQPPSQTSSVDELEQNKTSGKTPPVSPTWKDNASSQCSDLSGEVKILPDSKEILCSDTSTKSIKCCDSQGVLCDQTGDTVAVTLPEQTSTMRGQPEIPPCDTEVGEQASSKKGSTQCKVKMEEEMDPEISGQKELIQEASKDATETEPSDVRKGDYGTKPKPISPIEGPAIDFHSAVAKAVKAWSKPVVEKRRMAAGAKVEKAGGEKSKSLDVLLCRRKVPFAGYLDKVNKACSQVKEKQEHMPKISVGKARQYPYIVEKVKIPVNTVKMEVIGQAPGPGRNQGVSETGKLAPVTPTPCVVDDVKKEPEIQQQQVDPMKFLPVKTSSCSGFEKTTSLKTEAVEEKLKMPVTGEMQVKHETQQLMGKPLPLTTTTEVHSAKPVVQAARPVTQTAKLDAKVAKPDAQMAKAMAPTANVRGQSAKTDAQTGKTEVQVVQTVKPVAQMAKPVAQTAKPVAQATRPNINVEQRPAEAGEVLGQSFSVKWKTFGPVPEEVEIDIPFSVNGSPLKKKQDSTLEKRRSELVDKSPTVDKRANVSRNIVAQESSKEPVTGMMKSSASNSTAGARRESRVSSGESLQDFNEYHKELHKLVELGAVETEVESGNHGEGVSAVMDFMQYHKELHEMVKEEGVEMSLNDIVDLPDTINQAEDPAVSQISDLSGGMLVTTGMLGSTDGLEDTQYVCPFCDHERSFQRESDLTTHLKSLHCVMKDENEAFIDLSCPICKDLPVFSEHAMLLYHMRVIHSIANFDVRKKDTRKKDIKSLPNIMSSETSPIQSDTSPKVAAPRESKICSPGSDADAFSDVESICSDISNVTGITGIESGISLQREFIGKHPQLVSKVVNTRRMCSFCNIAFMKMEHYKRHVLACHTQQQKSLQWKCGMCQKPFGSQVEWRRHLRGHFPSRSNSGLGKSGMLTAQEKEVLREVARRESDQEIKLMYIKTPRDLPAKSVSPKPKGKLPGPSGRWDRVFGSGSAADVPEKVGKTYTRTSTAESTRKIIILQSVKNPGVSPPGAKQITVKNPGVSPPSAKQITVKNPGVSPPSTKQITVKNPGVSPPSAKQITVKNPDVSPPSAKKITVKNPDVSPPGAKQTTMATAIHPGKPNPSKKPVVKQVAKAEKMAVSKRLMKPLSVRIPGEDEQGDKGASSVQSSISSCQSSHVSSSSHGSTRNSRSSRSTSSPNSTVSSSSGHGRVSPLSYGRASPLSTVSNPEHCLRSPRAVAKRRCSCESHDESKRPRADGAHKERQMTGIKSPGAQAECQMTGTKSPGAQAERQMTGIKSPGARAERLLRSRVSPNDDKNTGHGTEGACQHVQKKSKMSTVKKSKAVAKTISPNTRSSGEVREDNTTGVEKYWKLPWEHYLRNTLKKQASSTRKLAQTKRDQLNRSPENKDSNSSLMKSKWKKFSSVKTSSSSLARVKAKLRKLPQRPAIPLSRRNSSDSQSGSITPGGRRRRSSVSSAHSDVSTNHKRRKTDTDLESARRQLAGDSFSPTRRISTRLNLTEEVKGMALHTRRAEHVAAVKQKQFRKAVAKSCKK